MNPEKSAIRLGVIFRPSFPPETLSDYASRAEAAGFDELWLWDDCFLPGALTSAAIALAATRQLKVGIGLIPATVINPLFAAMEITTLTRAFPQRILTGFGHGVGSWMTQIGAAPKSSLRALRETVTAVRHLLGGEMLSTQGEQVKLDQVQMQMTPGYAPPLYIGAMREKTLRLAGEIGDGTILTGLSSPAYVRWAREQIQAGMTISGRTQHRVVVYVEAKVSPDGETARMAVRKSLAARLPWVDAQTDVLGIRAETAELLQKYDQDQAARHIPEAWVDAFSAAGTPQQVGAAVQRWVDAGADSVVFQPLDGDPDSLEDYIHYLAPIQQMLR